MVSISGATHTVRQHSWHTYGHRGWMGSLGVAGDRTGGGTVTAQSVIGSDDTQLVPDVSSYPARAIGTIFRWGRPSCTGALISPDTVLTAGHCIHDGRPNTWYPGLTFQPGRSALTNYGECRPREDGLLTFKGWTDLGDERHDIGLIKLDCEVGRSVGWFGLWSTSRSVDGLIMTVQGYPGARAGQQWLSVGQIQHADHHQFFYEHDTLGGMSGSPAWQHRSWRQQHCTGPCIIGVHAYGLHGENQFHATLNHGARLTPAKYGAIRDAAFAP